MSCFPAKTGDYRPLLTEGGQRAQPAQIVGPRHARPKAGLRVTTVPPYAANLTGPARDAEGLAGRDGGTGGLIEPRNMDHRGRLSDRTRLRLRDPDSRRSEADGRARHREE